MRKKINAPQLLAVLSALGLAAGAVAAPAIDNSTARTKELKVSAPKEKQVGGKDAACGKGSCGTDEAGAKAAQKKHSTTKKSATTASKSAPSQKKVQRP